MAKQFVEGNKYVFSAKKFKNSVGKKNYREGRRWKTKLNGQEVTIKSTKRGECGYFLIAPQWCKCIENNQGRL
ncbi:hypothetical protein EXN54_20090 [Clostridium botulinum]|nr:hypothetical protein [Clostridium botulinum]NFA07596.1 hypothetical protein [Clostridium botulinum]NFA25801.1 hypothetical protein [Clostridium botulinum]NFB80994.1 hypothetical protein [Clostridium botulinum]NFB88850.1 hypothetical protein [Clostridium botulinum]